MTTFATAKHMAKFGRPLWQAYTAINLMTSRASSLLAGILTSFLTRLTLIIDVGQGLSEKRAFKKLSAEKVGITALNADWLVAS
jgi:hypothetical protein